MIGTRALPQARHSTEEFTLLRWIGAAVFMISMASNASAQHTSADDGALDAIIVTATKRVETLLNVPLSISVIDAQSIERKGVKNLEDLAPTVPGLVVLQSDEQSDKSFVIRGISSTSNAGTVALYVDDTPVTFGNNSPDLKLFDFSRVEVLRGPQGTLFGESAMGGSIRYISPEPDFVNTHGYVRAEAGAVHAGDSNYEVQGAIGGPVLSDKVAFRVSGFYRHDGGYIDLVNESTGDTVKSGINFADSYGGRAAFSTRIGDRITATLSVLYQKQEDNDLSDYYTGRGISDPISLPAFQKSERSPVYLNQRFALPNLTVNADLGFATLTSSTSYVNRTRELGSDFSYYVQSALQLPDSVGSSLIVSNLTKDTFTAVIEELRLASRDSGPLQWIAGAYFQHSRRTLFQSDASPNLGEIIPPLAPALLPGGVVALIDDNTRNYQVAGFGEISYRVTPALKVTGGIRVTRLTLHIDQVGDGFFNGGPTSLSQRSSETPVTPKLSVSYDLSKDAMIYATAARGFREGGPNRVVPVAIPACQAALQQLGRSDVPGSYNSDSLWSYELGAKWQDSLHRWTLRGAVYDIEWSDIQQTINLAGGCGYSYTDNVGQARSRGFEAEATYKPTSKWLIELNTGYTHAVLTRDLFSGADASGPILAAPRGTKLPDVPSWSASMAIQRDFAVNADWKGFLRTDLQFVDSSNRDLNTPADDPRNLRRDSYRLVSVRAALQRDQYELSVFARNLFNEDTVIYRNYQGFAPVPAAEETRLIPRTIGVAVDFRF